MTTVETVSWWDQFDTEPKRKDRPNDRHYLWALPTNEYSMDHQNQTFTVLTRRLLKDLATYDTSLPTGPTPGRIYKRNMTWNRTDLPDEYYVYICVAEPGDTGYILHVPYKVIIWPDILKNQLTMEHLSWLSEADKIHEKTAKIRERNQKNA